MSWLPTTLRYLGTYVVSCCRSSLSSLSLAPPFLHPPFLPGSRTSCQSTLIHSPTHLLVHSHAPLSRLTTCTRLWPRKLTPGAQANRQSSGSNSLKSLNSNASSFLVRPRQVDSSQTTRTDQVESQITSLSVRANVHGHHRNHALNRRIPLHTYIKAPFSCLPTLSQPARVLELW